MRGSVLFSIHASIHLSFAFAAAALRHRVFGMSGLAVNELWLGRARIAVLPLGLC